MTQLTTQPDSAVLSPPRPAASHAASPSTGLALLADLVQMTKLRIALMVAMTAALGYVLADGAHIEPPFAAWLVFAATLAGTALSSMGAAALNQIIERRLDALMPRTQDRPVAAGRVTPRLALGFALALCIAGLLVLIVFTTPLAAGLTLVTVLSYVLIYTPLKRSTSLSTIVGAVPGALPPLIGCAAVGGTISAPAALMFAVMFLWQLPHFLAIAWLYRDDYAAARFPMLPVIDPTGGSTFRQMLLTCLALIPLSLLPVMLGYAGALYFITALVAGLAFLAAAGVLVRRPTRAHARLVFFASLLYLPAVLAMMVIDKT